MIVNIAEMSLRSERLYFQTNSLSWGGVRALGQAND